MNGNKKLKNKLTVSAILGSYLGYLVKDIRDYLHDLLVEMLHDLLVEMAFHEAYGLVQDTSSNLNIYLI